MENICVVMAAHTHEKEGRFSCMCSYGSTHTWKM